MYFLFFTGILVCVNYISVIIFFPSVVVTYHLYWEKYKCCCCCARTEETDSDIPTPLDSKRKNPIVRFFGGPYYRFITHKIAKWFILLFYLVIFTVMMYWCTQVEVNEEQVITYNSHRLRYSFRHPLDVTMSITWCVLGLTPSLKYSYILHAKFWVSKPVIIIGSCAVKSWFTFPNLQSVCLLNVL